MISNLKTLHIEEVRASFPLPQSRASATKEGVRLFLSQSPHPDSLHRRRTRLFGGDHDAPPSPPEISEYLKVLARIPAEADVAVLSEHSAATACIETTATLASANRQIVIAALGFSSAGQSAHNSIAVAVPDRAPIILQKLSFSAEDQTQANDGKLLRGNKFVVFDSPLGRFSVLNCHEYTHAGLLAELAKGQLDFLVVTSFNPAWQLYQEYALADIHRLFCFVVLCNVGNYGGSGVFAPFSKLGPRDGALTAGGVLYSSRGPSNAQALLELPIGELRRLRRNKFRDDALGAFKKPADWYQPIVPPEILLMKHPPYQKVIKDARSIETIDLSSLGYRRRRKSGELNIGIGQLHSPPMDAYINNSYDISHWDGGGGFERKIQKLLASVDTELDFLVLPEVFATRGLDEHFRRFSSNTGAIVITGMEYEPQSDENLYGSEQAKGSNRCFIYVPTHNSVARFEYTKLTRSQYDALSRAKKSNGQRVGFHMELGRRLYRFTHPDIGDFGVLICYDLSHLDLVHAFNMRGRDEPLELMFVVCHNPYEDLYRACCLADCHRYYQFVALCNVANYGGSGLFGPLRTKGAARTLLQAGKNAEGIFIARADLAGLRTARKTADLELSAGAQKRSEGFQRRPGIYNVRWTQTHAVKTEDRVAALPIPKVRKKAPNTGPQADA